MQQSFSLNSKEYSAYPDEQEVLLQEGIQYKIFEIEKEGAVTVVRLRNKVEKYKQMNTFKRYYKLMVDWVYYKLKSYNLIFKIQINIGYELFNIEWKLEF